jgi:hypothetical protein
MKRLPLLFVFSICLLGQFLAAQSTAIPFEPFKKSNATSRLFTVEKQGIAGIYPDDPHFVFVKRIDNPGQEPLEVDEAHLAEKERLSLLAYKNQDMRRANTLADSMQVELGYQSNPFMNSTPMDNNLAVSNDGLVISVINTNIRITDSLGNTLLQRVMNASFFGDNSLTSTIYDPKILYDPDNDRFVLVVLHGNNSATSRVLVMFSRSNRPDIDGWHYYRLNGDAFLLNLWFDYPNIGINSKDVFITGNLFSNQNAYGNVVVFQLDKLQGYEGVSNIGSRVWGGAIGQGMIQDADNNLPFTLVPAPSGFDKDASTDMYLVSTTSNTGNRVYVYRITAPLRENPVMETSVVNVDVYVRENLCVQLNSFNANNQPIASPIRLISGDARMKNAYIQNGSIHCVWNARPAQTTFLRIFYARIDVRNRVAFTNSYTDNAGDYAFAAVAPFSTDRNNPTALIVYTSTSATKFPDIGVITCGPDMKFSNPLTVKAGESPVSIFPSNNSTRWGDYSGIAKRFNSPTPQVWISASYGALTSGSSIPRHWNNWNAKIVSKDEPTLYFGKNVVYPNPAPASMEALTFNFMAEKAGRYTLLLYDASGKKIKDLYEDNLLPGEHRVVFSAEGLSIGAYFIQFVLDGKSLGAEKMIVVEK